MILFPCAKINLGLNVVERRADGYHNIETVFYPIPLTDALEVKRMSEEFPLNRNCSLKVTGNAYVGPEEDNLVVKAYDILAKDYELPRVFAHLHKMIPSEAGLGGGSSDAAYMLRLIDEGLHLNIGNAELERYAVKLGADCPFFITTDLENPEPMFATGIGEILQPVAEEWNTLDGKWLALVKPSVSVSTKAAYQKITPQKPAKSCREIIMQPIETWKDELVNDFEAAVFDEHPVLREVKEDMYEAGAVYAQMSGSGSTIFGIFDKEPSFVETKYNEYFTKILRL